MNLEQIKRNTNPFHPYNIMVISLAIVLVGWCWHSTEMGVTKLLDGWGNMLTYLSGNPEIKDSGFFPPDLASGRLLTYLKSMLETVQMALLALVISILIAFPLSFFASKNTLSIIIPGTRGMSMLLKNVIYTSVRFVANLSRSINEIIWALLFVSAVGLGPMPGILALGIHTSGVLIKLFSEGIEAIQQEPIDALSATGAGFVKVIRYAVFPQITPFFVSMTLYRLESDVRSATILGFTGAGGIGVYLFDKLKSYENREVTTILIIIVITVAIIDRISAAIRAKYT
ncbi:MAG TPA: phosphonate ABC transporter, permease protein PhnE [Desulfuromonadales bacterium]|nr:phosphonate ABC transporter, permease protein PhnE [Desulfuromonadales bacterium]